MVVSVKAEDPPQRMDDILFQAVNTPAEEGNNIRIAPEVFDYLVNGNPPEIRNKVVKI